METRILEWERNKMEPDKLLKVLEIGLKRGHVAVEVDPS
jgi:hypothetical protein